MITFEKFTTNNKDKKRLDKDDRKKHKQQRDRRKNRHNWEIVV